MQISNALNNYRLQGAADWHALGAGKATAHVYAGTQPEFGGTPSGDLLMSVEFATPIGTIANGVLTITPTAEAMVLLTGTATWARIVNGAGDLGYDVPVSDLNGTAPLKLQSTTLYAGGYGRIVSGTLI